MRKAFDENVPRLKPRLKFSTLFPQAEAEGSAAVAVQAEDPATVAQVPGTAPSASPEQPVASSAATQVVVEVKASPAAVAPMAPAPVAASAAAQTVSVPKAAKARVAPVVPAVMPTPVAATPVASPPRDPVAEAQARRRKLKERLRAASQPVTLAEPTPPTAVEARASALSLVGQLQAELEKQTALNKAMAADLDAARTELARAIEEAKGRSLDSERMAAEVAERARLIEELGAELSGLEGERDDVLGEFQSARAEALKLNEETKSLQDELLRRERELEDAVSEEERLASELEGRTDELRKSRAMVATLSNERSALIEQVARLSKEKEDLSDAQKALSEIHKALAEARVRTTGGMPPPGR